MRWMWIDTIVEYEAARRMVAVKTVSRAEEHLDQHVTDAAGEPVPVMPASLIIEGMAQTAGILVGAANGFQEKVILAKVVKVELADDLFPGDVVRYEAVVDRLDSMGAATKGTVRRLSPPFETWADMGRIDLLFSHVDQNRAGLEFPEDNFVFGENLRAIIGDLGMAELLEAGS